MLGPFVGSVFGALVLGGVIYKHFSNRGESSTHPYDYIRNLAADAPSGSASSARRDRATVFVAAAAAMLAKLAKADGRVSPAEINSVERAFEKLGFPEKLRRFAIRVFNIAKDDNHTILEYAAEFANVAPSIEVREFLYELLWDVACADGYAAVQELELLRRVTAPLAIRSSWFDFFARERLKARRGGDGAPPTHPRRDELAEAFKMLDATPGMSDDELKRAYREKAKKFHPDVLRAQGLPEAMVAKATERMAKINEAWSRIREVRNIR